MRSYPRPGWSHRRRQILVGFLELAALLFTLVAIAALLWALGGAPLPAPR